MQKINLDLLMRVVQEYNNSQLPWHHHFLTPHCHFNAENCFRIIVENETTEEIFYCDFEEKPLKELKQLEELFFKQKTQS